MKNQDCPSDKCAGNKCLLVMTTTCLNVQHQYSAGFIESAEHCAAL